VFVGLASSADDPIARETIRPFSEAMQAAGWLDGKNVRLHYRFGGGDPAGWLNKLKGRIPLLHLKDYAVNDDNQPVFAALGDGNLDFPSILSAARAGGCEWYIVEQDAGFTDAFVAIETSLRFLESPAAGGG